jgi:hypothetical protein
MARPCKLLLCVAIYGGLQYEMQPLHEDFGCWGGGRPGEEDTAYLLQAVGELLLELASLVGRYGLSTVKA